MEMQPLTNDKRVNTVTGAVIGAAVEVHRELGPGLLESAYEACLAHELVAAGLGFDRQRPIPLTYKTERIDVGFRADFIVADSVLVELKAVEQIQPIHLAQVLTYLKLTGLHLGLLINVNVKVLQNGIRRIVRGLEE